MMLVGLTGGIASGKSTASEVFAGLGVQVIDADAIAHSLLESNSQVKKKITHRYGEQVVQCDGSIDRDYLRKKTMEADDLPWLESILHPLIREQILAAIEVKPIGYALVVVPLLFETGFDELVDTTLVVDVDEQTQWNRAIARPGMEERQLRFLLMRQYKRKERLQRADRVIDGTADIHSFRKKVIEIAHLYEKMAANRCKE